MSEIQLPSVKSNALLLRIEKAIFVKENCKFGKNASIEFEKSGKKVEFYVQALDDASKMDYSSPVKKTTLDSIDGTSTEPVWTTQYSDDYTNGDVWIPIDSDRSLLTVKVKSSHFVGLVSLDISKDKAERKDYDLFDEQGKKLEGSSLRLSFELGSYYEIEFRTGDPNFAPGTGTEPLFLNALSPVASVVFANLYKKLKRFNPFGIGQQTVDKGYKTVVTFQLNGLKSRSRFYMAKSGESGQTETEIEPKRKMTFFKYKFFVTSQVGTPLSISVRFISGLDTKVTWFLDNVLMKHVGDESEFMWPCYQWITEGRVKTLSLPYGILPQTVTKDPMFEYLRLERINEIEVARSKYQWDLQTVVPSFIRGTAYGSYDLIPLDEKFDDYKTKDFSYLISQGLANTGITYALNKIFPMSQIEDYTKLYNMVIPSPTKKPIATAENWSDDAFFGWTTIAGLNPLRIQLVKSVPSQFLKEKDLYKDASGNPLDLEDECRHGRLYYVDYSGLAKYNLHTEGVAASPELQHGQRYTSPATGLFYVGNDFKLRPIAIQLIPNGVIYTPRDTKWQWLYAKMSLRNAESQYHQVIDHWMTAHAISETLSIAIRRSLSRIHPVHRLLLPHLKYTIGINTLARRSLINAGGFVNQLESIGEKLNEFLIDEFAKVDFTKWDFISRLEERGFTRESKGALTDFPYYDDGLLVWDAIYDFIGQYLALYYQSDEDVVRDHEVADWMREIKLGFHGHTFETVDSIVSLQKLVTTIIWNVSCHHSVVNFNQYDMQSFIPNSPSSLYKQPPITKEQIDEKFIMESLPGPKHASVQILLANVLSSFTDNEEYLTSQRYIELIGEPKAVTWLESYRKRLREIDVIIGKRNEERVSKGFFEYKLLMPSHVPNSIAI